MTRLSGALVGVAALACSAMAAPIIDDFNIVIGPQGELLAGGGSGYNNGEWYFYPDSGWYNQWFYDHPFDPDRWKEIHIEFDMVALDPILPSEIDFAVNWSTPAWETFPDHEFVPPIPDLVGPDEDVFIGRQLLTDETPGFEVVHYEFDYVIPDYNPEWVSIDVRGFNFEIFNGVIIHDCVPTPAGVTLLALGGLCAARRRR